MSKRVGILWFYRIHTHHEPTSYSLLSLKIPVEHSQWETEHPTSFLTEAYSLVDKENTEYKCRITNSDR